MDFSNFIKNIQFYSNVEILYDKKNNHLGLIYNLEFKHPLIPFDIKNAFKTHPLIGLQNIGSFPFYMNSIIQIFCQIEEIINYFKYKPEIINVINKYNKNQKTCLTKAFKNIIENIWPSNDYYIRYKYCHENDSNRYFAPYEFFQIFNQIWPYNSSNPKDLINIILMKLHEELNKINKNITINDDKILDQTNQKLMKDNFYKKFVDENRSIISDNFYGSIQTMIKCFHCNIIKYNYDVFSFLEFPLDEVYHYKYVTNINQQNQMINIYDCFDYFQRIQTLSNEDALLCEYCKSISSNLYKAIINTVPNIFIIIVDKKQNSEIKFEFYEKIDLSNYIQLKSIKCIFKLIGVICQIGEKDRIFYSYCKSPIDNNWFKFNNDLVSKVVDFKNEVINCNFPHILFYKINEK